MYVIDERVLINFIVIYTEASTAINQLDFCFISTFRIKYSLYLH